MDFNTRILAITHVVVSKNPLKVTFTSSLSGKTHTRNLPSYVTEDSIIGVYYDLLTQNCL